MARLQAAPPGGCPCWAERTRHQVVNWRRSKGIGPAGQAAVPGQEPGEGEPFGVGEGGLDRDEGSG
jgi:hypothetical protein